MRPLLGLNELREQGRMTWIEDQRGWVATPEDIVTALSNDGFAECKRETTTSRRDLQPAGGVWQGVNTRTGSVASAIWVNQSAAGTSHRLHHDRWGVGQAPWHLRAGA